MKEFFPKVSIIIYDADIKKAINDISKQTYTNVELLVFTNEQPNEVNSKLNIKYFKRKSKNIIDDIKKVESKIEGEYISLYTGNIEYDPKKIEIQIFTINALQDKDTVLCNNYTEKGNKVCSIFKDNLVYQLLENKLNINTFLISTKLANKYLKDTRNINEYIYKVTKTKQIKQIKTPLINKQDNEHNFKNEELKQIIDLLSNKEIEKIQKYYKEINEQDLSLYCANKLTKEKEKITFDLLIDLKGQKVNIEKTIKTLIDQTYKNYKIYVIGDKEEYKHFEKNNEQIKVVKNINEIKLSNYVTFINEKCYFDKFYLSNVADFLNENKDAILISNFKYFAHKKECTTRFDTDIYPNTSKNGYYVVLKNMLYGFNMFIPSKLIKNNTIYTSTDYIENINMYLPLLKDKEVFLSSFNMITYNGNIIEKKGNEEALETILNNITDTTIKNMNIEKIDFYYELMLLLNDLGFENLSKKMKDNFYKLYKNETAKVTIIMPCYNSEKHLNEAIDSLLNQTFGNFELICIDDNSKDKTWEILTNYTKQDPRVRISKNKNTKGVSGGMNTGLDLANGKYITRMDSDDISDKNRIKLQVTFLENNTDYDLCSVNINNITKKGKKINDYIYEKNTVPYEWKFLFESSIPCAPCMYKKEMLEGLRFNEYYTTAEDYNFLASLVDKHKFHLIEEVLYSYRVYETSLSNASFNKTQNNSINVSQNYYKKITGKNPPLIFSMLTPYLEIVDSSYDHIKEVQQFLDETIEIFNNYFNWTEEQYIEANNYKNEIFSKYLNKIITSEVGEILKEAQDINNSFAWKIVKHFKLIGKTIKSLKENGLKITINKIRRFIWRKK